MSSDVELARLKAQAKLEVLKAVRDFIDERINELQTLIPGFNEQPVGPKPGEQIVEPKATERQIQYALDLASKTGFKVSRTDLQKMSRKEVSNLIDRLLEKNRGS